MLVTDIDETEYRRRAAEWEATLPRWERIEKALADRGVDADKVSLSIHEAEMPLDVLEALLGL
jgi:hypothetical protein